MPMRKAESLTKSITSELTSHGFAWERKSEPQDFLSAMPKPRKRKPSYDAGRVKSYKARQREKWLLMGIVKPKDENESALVLRAQRAEGEMGLALVRWAA